MDLNTLRPLVARLVDIEKSPQVRKLARDALRDLDQEIERLTAPGAPQRPTAGSPVLSSAPVRIHNPPEA